MNIRLLSILLVVGILFSAACGATKQARTVDRLGFLKDLYPKMVEGNEDGLSGGAGATGVVGLRGRKDVFSTRDGEAAGVAFPVFFLRT